jgi:quercetin dioxygenase-like cupin family protein
METKQRGRTSGTTRRPARQMSGQGEVFQLAAEVAALRADLRHTSGGRAAKTLAKTDGLRVTLVLLASGAVLNPESTAGGVSLHVIEGALRVQIEGDTWDVGAGDVVVLEDNLREPVTAMAETAFLVTVAWTVGDGASDQERRKLPL